MRFSIIIPMFNAELTIVDTLSSALAQNMSGFEVVVVDDHSSDRSWELVESRLAKFSNLKLIKNLAKGANSARMSGVQFCSGDYIVFLDSDDRLSTNCLAKFNSEIESYSPDLVCADMSLVDETGRQIKGRIFNYNLTGLHVEMYEGRSVAYKIPPSACSKLFKASILKKITFLDVPFAQDWNITYKYVAHCKNVCFLNESIYQYIRRQGSTSERARSGGNNILDACGSVLDINAYWRSLGCTKSQSKFLNHLLFRFYLNIFARLYSLASEAERKKYYHAVLEGSPKVRSFEGAGNCYIRSPGELSKYAFYVISKSGYFFFSFLFGRFGRALS